MPENTPLFVQTVPIQDWILLSLFFIFAIIGFIRGGAKIIIHSLWAIAGIFIAKLLYQDLADLGLLNFISQQRQVILFASFLIIFVFFILLKLFIYRLVKIITNISGPCSLNRFFAAIIGLFLVIVLSKYIANDINNIDFVRRIFVSDMLRISLLFAGVFFIIIITFLLLSRLLSFKISTDKPCPLIVALQPLDNILNARGINSLFNNIMGVVFAVLNGFIFIIFIIIINNHFFLLDDYVLYNSTESNNLIYFKNLASNAQQTLANYLLFINK